MVKARIISRWLLLLMVFLQIGLSVLENREQAVFSDQEITIDQIYGDVDHLNPDCLIAEIADNFSHRVELGSTVFYTLPQFSLDVIHAGLMRVQWLLSHLVIIQFDKPDIIFPFAYFW